VVLKTARDRAKVRWCHGVSAASPFFPCTSPPRDSLTPFLRDLVGQGGPHDDPARVAAALEGCPVNRINLVKTHS
jgi:hypothetical protein